MSFSGYEDQRLPRELDDYEHKSIGCYELCAECGDRACADDATCRCLYPKSVIVNDEWICSGECAAAVVSRLWTDELAARAVPEEIYDDETTPLPVERMADVVDGRLR